MSWFKESAATIKALFTPAHGFILPAFGHLDPLATPPGAALLFYGTPGNTLTERLGTNKYRFPYNPPPFHAALMMRDGMFHNVGQFKTQRLLSSALSSTRRIDAVVPKLFATRPDLVSMLMQNADLDLSVPHFGLETTDYGVADFLHFGFSFIRHGKDLVCSGDLDKLWGTVGVQAAQEDEYHAAPWDILTNAMSKPEQFDIWTIHIGKDFAPHG